MSAFAKMSAPLDQGQFGTCVGHAFSKCLVDGVLGKYAVPLKVEDILAAVKISCPCWEGKHLEPLTNEWNKNVAGNSSLYFSDVDNCCRYRVGVEIRRIDTVQEAYAEAQKTEGVLLLMTAIKTGADGHGSHAVAVDKPYKKPNEMRGLNSWGAEQTFMDVTPANFQYAVAFDPIILEKKQGSRTKKIPATTRGYDEMGAGEVKREECEPSTTRWDDIVYTKRQPTPGNTSCWYAFRGRSYYRLTKLNKPPASLGTLGGNDVDGNPMANVDAVAYSGEGQKQNYFYVFKGRHYYRYKYLCDPHDGAPGTIGGQDSEGNPMSGIDGATYTRGVYTANWYIVKGQRYYRYGKLYSDHDNAPGTLHSDIDGISGLECTGGHSGHSKWYLLGTGPNEGKYLRLKELNAKPDSSGTLVC